MAAHPDLPLKPQPANRLLDSSRTAALTDTRRLERRLAGIAFPRSPANIARSHRADFFLAGAEISLKLRRR
jgi:hypothetical protein